MSWVLGIDFGTTTSAAATRPIEQPVSSLVRFGDEYRMSSAVLLEPDGSLSTGNDVLREGVANPDRVERCPKRKLGQGQLPLGDSWVADTRVVSAVLRTMYVEACELYGGDPPQVVRLTHPVRWEQRRRDALMAGAREAGMVEPELVPEPIAAAYGLLSRVDASVIHDDDVISLFDFGGGTLDIAMLRYSSGAFEVCGPYGGDDHLGGEHVNDLLMRYLAGKLPPEDGRRLMDPFSVEESESWTRLAFEFREQVRLAKESLAKRSLARIMLGYPLQAVTLELSESELNQEVAPVVRHAAELLEASIRQSGLEPGQVAAVFLAGGSSRLAYVQRFLGAKLQVPIPAVGDPKALVALGAAERPVEAKGRLDGPATQETIDIVVVRSSGNVTSANAPAASPPVQPEARVAALATPAASAPQSVATQARHVAATAGGVVQALSDQFARTAEEISYRAGRLDGYHVDHWLVSVGDEIDVFTPLAWVSNHRHEVGAFRVYAMAGGRVSSRLVEEGGDLHWNEPMVALTAIHTLLRDRMGPPSGATGVILTVPPALPSNTPTFASVNLLPTKGRNPQPIGVPRRLNWGFSYALICPSGGLRVMVTDRSGAGRAMAPVTVPSGGWAHLTYLHPVRAGREGRLEHR